MKKLFLTLICLTLVLVSCGKAGEATESRESETVSQLSDVPSVESTEIPDEYPELDVSNGLCIYVSEVAPGVYRFKLLERAAGEPENTELIGVELIGVKSFNTDQTRFLLDHYGLGKNDVTIIPWQDPLSSYLSPWMISFNGEDTAPKKAEYAKQIEKLLFE